MANDLATVPAQPRASALAVMAARFNLEPRMMIATLKATVIRGPKDREASDEECAAFLVVANEYGLNPFTREIHAFVDPHRGVVPLIGVDGWARIVNEHRQCAGFEFEDVLADGKLVAITCRMWRRDRERPVVITEWLEECRRDTPPWRQMPRRMLRHKALKEAARYAFGFAGLHDEDEAREIEATVVASRPVERASILRPSAAPHQDHDESAAASVAAAKARAAPVEPEPPRTMAPAVPVTTIIALAPARNDPASREAPGPASAGDDGSRAEAPRDPPAPSDAGQRPRPPLSSVVVSAPAPDGWLSRRAKASALCFACRLQINASETYLYRYEPKQEGGRGELKRHAACADPANDELAQDAVPADDVLPGDLTQAIAELGLSATTRRALELADEEPAHDGVTRELNHVARKALGDDAAAVPLWGELGRPMSRLPTAAEARAFVLAVHERARAGA